MTKAKGNPNAFSVQQISRSNHQRGAGFDESIERISNVLENVNIDLAFDGLRWAIDHAEIITPKNIERVKALGGGIAIQSRMAFAGEVF